MDILSYQPGQEFIFNLPAFTTELFTLYLVIIIDYDKEEYKELHG
mgnify:CR=1 FL=1